MHFNVYIFRAQASVYFDETLTLSNFRGKTMQSDGQERSFSSKFVTPKCNYSKENIFKITQQQKKFLFFFFYNAFFLGSFAFTLKCHPTPILQILKKLTGTNLGCFSDEDK